MKRAATATSNKTLTLMDHIRELRTRFFIVAIVFITTSCVAYGFHDEVLAILLSPLEGQKLIYLTPAGGFNFILLISIYVGLAAPGMV